MAQILLKSLLFFSIAYSSAYAGETKLSRLASLSLDELENVEVTSASRKPESRFRAAAAITVLSHEDIRRSGATSIPEALRMVPGLNVAKIDSNKWAISARGFNREFSNKLLVQVDGRSVYTPLFSGVYWDVQDTILEDVERIEIIRGPGATLWGANAVNGIINIITKNSELTQGNYLSATYGNQERGMLEYRHGGKLGENVSYRTFGKYLRRDEFETLNTNNGNNDDWEQGRFGLRADWKPSLHDDIRFQGEYYNGENQQTFALPGLITPGVNSPIDVDTKVSGGNILGSWTHKANEDSEQKLQVYLDYVSRLSNNVLEQSRITFDVDYQNRFFINERNDFIWGVGYRYFKDHLDDISLNGNEYVAYEPNSSSNNLYSAFVQNEFAVIPDKLYLTLGSKFEDNFFTGFEAQPNARFSWHASDNQTVWGAVSRAVRIPTRGERGLAFTLANTGGGFVRSVANANGGFDAEEALTYELGHRIRPNWWYSIDTTLFYSEYDNLRAFEPGASGFNIPNTAAEFVASNTGLGKTYGFEIATQFSLSNNWKVFANYTFLEMELQNKPGSQDSSIAGQETQSPENQFSILSRYNINEDIELDMNIYLVENLSNFDVPGYTRFDTRIAWDVTENVNISLVGQNLFEKDHQEFAPSIYSTANEVPRSVYAKVQMKF